MDRLKSQKTGHSHQKAVRCVEPSRSSEKRQAEKVMEKDYQGRIQGYWNVLGASETDGTKSSPLEKDCGGPMLRSEWRGLD